ncbi:hypothetical protein K458DRAFT_153170 [Lentithecium fluviatile CBS 122367]|uniref:Uncharacterized protein n=1 Tax=Lentithecium fluviatile CBS 122367 TaxID=1168545 RepID=A0A6G1JFB5_9PLEO|nr:hypothetical protein K458DRAFT_153170 [Lentithecium fluviatile CBS 122367]
MATMEIWDSKNAKKMTAWLWCFQTYCRKPHVPRLYPPPTTALLHQPSTANPLGQPSNPALISNSPHSPYEVTCVDSPQCNSMTLSIRGRQHHASLLRNTADHHHLTPQTQPTMKCRCNIAPRALPRPTRCLRGLRVGVDGSSGGRREWAREKRETACISSSELQRQDGRVSMYVS